MAGVDVSYCQEQTSHQPQDDAHACKSTGPVWLLRRAIPYLYGETVVYLTLTARFHLSCRHESATENTHQCG